MIIIFLGSCMSVKMQLPLLFINHFCYCSFAFLVYCCVGKTLSVLATVPTTINAVVMKHLTSRFDCALYLDYLFFWL